MEVRCFSRKYLKIRKVYKEPDKAGYYYSFVIQFLFHELMNVFIESLKQYILAVSSFFSFFTWR